MDKKEIKKHILSIILVSTFLIFITTFVYLPKQEKILASFAFLQAERNFYVEELTSGILLKAATPVSDEEGLESNPYTFKIVNKSSKDIAYQIKFNSNKEKIEALGKQVLPNRYLRYSLKQNNNDIVKVETLTENGVIHESVIEANSELTFDFSMWLDYNVDNGAMNKSIVGKIEINRIK